jgi:urease accessory protein
MSLTLAHALPLGGSVFAAGLLHPATGLDHLLAAVAVGVAGAALGGRLRWGLPLAFLASMVLGVLVGGHLGGAAFEGALAASVAGLGLLAVTRSPHAALALGAAALFGLFHGHAHGTEFAGAGVAAYGAGLLFGTAAIHAGGALVGRLGVQATRAAGSGLTAAGLLLLAL